MGNNELSSLLDTLITMIVVTVIISVVVITAYLGITIKDEATGKTDDLLNVTDTAYVDVESMIDYKKGIPMASIYKIVKAAGGDVYRVETALIIRALIDYDNPTAYYYYPYSVTNINDYSNKFNMKFVVEGTKNANGTYNLTLTEVM